MKMRLILALLLILSLIWPLAACNGQNSAWLGWLSDPLRRNQPGGNLLTANQLAQKIADAVRSDTNITEAFNSIPDKQKDGLSLDEFQQYVRFLRRAVSGVVTSFSEMSATELAAARQKVLDRLPETAEQLAELAGYWIHFQEKENYPGKIAIYIRQPEEQIADLYAGWIRRILELKDLAALYFDALDRQDTEALAFLIKTPELADDIVLLRAGRLIDFYNNNITSRSAEFKLTHAEIDSIGFEEFGIINPDKSQAVSRIIELQRRPDGGFFIDDVLPEVMLPEDRLVFYQSRQLLQLGLADGEAVQVQSGDLESIIGPPLVHDDTVCTSTATGAQRINLTYAPLELRAEGSCFRHSRWNGQVKFLLLESPDCKLGSGLRPGATKKELLRRYPFAQEAGFIIRSQADIGNIRLRFIMEDEAVSAIELTVN